MVRFFSMNNNRKYTFKLQLGTFIYQARHESGFTLAEVVVVVAIMTLIMLAVAVFQYNVLDYNRSTASSLTTAQEAQSIIKTVAKELRAMQQSESGSYPIASAGTSTLIFYSDVNGDGLNDRVRYYMSGSTLFRGLIMPTGSPLGYTGSESVKILATGILNSPATPIFEYFGGNYAGTSSAMMYPLTITDIRSIKIGLTIDADPNKIPVMKVFSTQATLRNLKDNL